MTKRRMDLRVVAGLVLLLGLAAAPAPAQQSPNKDNGFAPEKVFHAGDLDSVNAFNGNLVLTLPIGSSYPVGGGLSYQLTLVYNSNLWEYVDLGGGNSTTVPNRLANAGLGWRLSL